MAIQYITIQYSPDSGSTWYTIEEQYPVDSGSYNWTAPYTESTNYLIRIYDSGAFANGYDLGDAYDVSDFTFSVLPPPSASLEYSIDNGITWIPIATVSFDEGTGSYSWYAPETASTQYLIRISSESISDQSDNTFTVFAPFSMSGNIKSASGEILTNINLTYTNNGPFIFYDPLTGDYISDIFTSSYTGELIPTANDYYFVPESRSYTNAVNNFVDQDFIAYYSESILQYYSISGSVLVSGTNTPISGAKITFNDYISNETITIKYSDLNGIYSASFVQNTNLEFFATHPLYTIDTPAKVIYNLSSNYTDQIFSGSIITYIISGSISSASGFLSNVEILRKSFTSITGSLTLLPSIYTDANGQYSFSHETGSSIILTPVKSGYIFSPSSIIVNNISASSFNNDFFAVTVVSPDKGESLYYDSRKLYDTQSNVWPDLSSKLPDFNMSASNVQYILPEKSLLFGANTISSASFYGIQVSSSFAIEMWIAPTTASYEKTLLSTEKDDYPQIIAYVTESKFIVQYKNNITQTEFTTLKSYNINESKYNYIVLFTSESYMYLWSNGICYESASITMSDWNGAVIGINKQFDNINPYQGFINVIKVWNGIETNLTDVNNYYISRSYWQDLQTANILIP